MYSIVIQYFYRLHFIKSYWKIMALIPCAMCTFKFWKISSLCVFLKHMGSGHLDLRTVPPPYW